MDSTPADKTADGHDLLGRFHEATVHHGPGKGWMDLSQQEFYNTVSGETH